MAIFQIEDRPIKWLKDNIQRVNICEDFDEPTLNAIGEDVITLAEMDEASRSEWKDRTERGMKTAMQVMEEKSFPWAGAANTKDTLIAEAAMQFAARASAEINKGGDIVRTKLTGNDPDGLKESRGKRVGQYMSYECTDIMPEWEPDTEQLLTSVSVMGMYYKKTYRDECLKRSVSMARSPFKVIVNENTRTLDLAERITDIIELTRNEIVERIRSGIWADITDKLGTEEDDGELYEFYEQHCWYDLDNDGYKEPYIVTAHTETNAVCRVCCRYDEEGIQVNKDKDGKEQIYKITALQHFTEYPFLYSPDGKFHKIGFAHLLGPITDTINTVQNQLLDAGTLANVPPVFVGRGAKLPAGGIKVHPGKVNLVECSGQDLKANIVIPQLTGPSDTLFKMLGLLREEARKLATVSDAMQGDLPGANVPATTTLALLDQGLKVFSAILVRLFRSFKAEYKKLYRLDSIYLTDEEYANVVDFTPEDEQAFKQMGYDETAMKDPRWIVKHDFGMNDCNVQPVLDPRAASEALRLARLNAMVQAANLPPNIGKIYLKGIGTPEHDIKQIYPDQQPPNPAMVKLQADITEMQHKNDLKERELDLKYRELELKHVKQVEDIVLERTQGMLNIANAEKAEIGTQLDTYKAALQSLEAQINAMAAAGKEQNGAAVSGGSDGGRSGTVAQEQDNAQGDEVSASPGGPGDAGLAGWAVSADLTGGSGPLDGNNVSAVPNAQPHAAPGDVAQAKGQPGSMM